MLQSRLSFTSPVQLAPPYLGAGFVQVLFLLCVPVPHVFVHCDQEVKFDHPPLTEIVLCLKLKVSHEIIE